MNKYSIFAFLASFFLFFGVSKLTYAGEKIYQQSCASCHDQGMFGAPRVGFRQDWDTRLAKGSRVLVRNSILGFQGATGFMPPKGGDTSLSDSDVEKAVKYMIEQAW